MINFSNIDKKLLTIIIISILATFNAAYLTYSAYTIETVAQFSF
jgi:flagellar basal body-associated protein FliL